MKRITGLVAAIAAVVWAVSRRKKPTSSWAEATDKV